MKVGFYIQQANDCSAMAERCGDFVLKEKWLQLAIEWIALEAEEILALPLVLRTGAVAGSSGSVASGALGASSARHLPASFNQETRESMVPAFFAILSQNSAWRRYPSNLSLIRCNAT